MSAFDPVTRCMSLVAQEADTIAVPDVRGETEENALADLVDAGLLPGGRFTCVRLARPGGTGHPDRPAHRAPRWRSAPLSPTTCRVDHGPRRPRPPQPSPVLVGNYRCVDLDHARQQIKDAGHGSWARSTPPAPQSDGSWLVQDQDPAAGAEVDPGTTVRLTVTDPAEPCT